MKAKFALTLLMPTALPAYSWADECGTLWRERSVGFGSQAE